MGETHAVVSVRREPRARKHARVRCIVDTGADHSVLPRELLRDLGVRPHRRESFTLADGTTIEREIGRVFLELHDVAEYTPVIFGEAGDATLLGVLTLEELGFGVDPIRRELIPLRLRM